MTHLQHHQDYGLQAVHDPEVENYLSELLAAYGPKLSFIETLREIAARHSETPSIQSLQSLNLDYDLVPSSPSLFFSQITSLARDAPHTASACLDTSSISSVQYNAATGGVKEVDRPYQAAFFIDRYISRVEEMQSRNDTPFAVLKALAAGPKNLDFSDYVCRYEVFCGPQENDGRIQERSFPDQVVARGVLLCVVLAEEMGMNANIQSELDAWVNRLNKEIGQSVVDVLLKKYRRMATTMTVEEKVRSMMCTMSGRMFVVERPDEAIGLYYWDPEPLKEVRKALKKYTEDSNGPKMYGFYVRKMFAWWLVFAGACLSMFSGLFNWAGRDNTFERVNDVFSTFLLVLSFPAFTVKIASTNGDQAIKDWLTGVTRIKSVEQLESLIHRRVRCNKRRAWLAIQRVKCETDDRQNWTAPDNMSFKTGHLNGSLKAKTDRNMSDLELVIGTNGETARSWVEVSNETNIIAGDVNHLQFTCGTTIVPRTPAFFSNAPSRRVWFA